VRSCLVDSHAEDHIQVNNLVLILPVPTADLKFGDVIRSIISIIEG
jgi:hypothetical protein